MNKQNKQYNHQKRLIREQKQEIEKQNQEIESLRLLNRYRSRTIQSMQSQMYQQYADVMRCLCDQHMIGTISEEQAGQLMLDITGSWDFSCE